MQFKVKAVWPEMEMHALRQLVMKCRDFHFSCFEATANQLLDLMCLWGREVNFAASS